MRVRVAPSPAGCPAPGTGTEPGSSSGLGAAPAPGTRRFSRIILAVGPPVRTDQNREFSKVSFFLGRVFERRFEPANGVGHIGRTDRHTVPVGTRPTENLLLFPSFGDINR